MKVTRVKGLFENLCAQSETKAAGLDFNSVRTQQRQRLSKISKLTFRIPIWLAFKSGANTSHSAAMPGLSRGLPHNRRWQNTMDDDGNSVNVQEGMCASQVSRIHQIHQIHQSNWGVSDILLRQNRWSFISKTSVCLSVSLHPSLPDSHRRLVFLVARPLRRGSCKMTVFFEKMSVIGQCTGSSKTWVQVPKTKDLGGVRLHDCSWKRKCLAQSWHGECNSRLQPISRDWTKAD